MAQRVVTYITCDIHMVAEGEEIEAVDTKYFTWEGRNRKLDLCADHLGEIEETFNRLLSASVSHDGSHARTRRQALPPAGEPRVKASVVRAWAAEQGMSVNDRGRVAASVLKAYEEAHGAA